VSELDRQADPRLPRTTLVGAEKIFLADTDRNGVPRRRERETQGRSFIRSKRPLCRDFRRCEYPPSHVSKKGRGRYLCRSPARPKIASLEELSRGRQRNREKGRESSGLHRLDDSVSARNHWSNPILNHTQLTGKKKKRGGTRDPIEFSWKR